MVWFPFNAKKSTQAAALLLKLSGGGKDKYVLLKMLYLADREAMRLWCAPITGDGLYSMEYGPVPSTIYDLTKGGIRHSDEWKEAVECDSFDNLRLKSDPGIDELSQAEQDILVNIFSQFGSFNFAQMKSYSHGLPEYDESIGKSSKPISIPTLLKALGKSNEEIDEAIKTAVEFQRLETLFGE